MMPRISRASDRASLERQERWMGFYPRELFDASDVVQISVSHRNYDCDDDQRF
jgi:hypothetical protein